VFVTARSGLDLEDEVAEALDVLGIPTTTPDLAVDGRTVALPVLERAHPNPAELADLVAAHPVSLLVADRISEAGRDLLRRAGWSWLDRRGHLRIWVPGARVEASFAAGPARQSGASTNVWTAVGLEVAVWAMLHPTEPVRARRVAPDIGRSIGATHELIARFTHVGLVGPTTHLPLLPDLFWETSARWPDDGWIGLPVPLADVAARVGADRLVRVDERAATLGGARIAAAGDLPARCYVVGASALRRLRGLVEAGQPSRCFVRPSPVAWLPELADHPPDDRHPWRVAHPVVCALRLAADPARGREIVDAWGIVPGSGSEAS